MTVRWSDHAVPFTLRGERWSAAVGVDLDSTPGDHAVDVTFTYADGHTRVVREPVHFDGRVVTFADGGRAEVDHVIYATGYRLTFPFIAPEILAAGDNRVRLYMRTFHPGHPTLSVIGAYQAQAQWGFLPLMEAQSRLVAGHLAGSYALPPVQAMQEAIAEDERDTARRFVDTPRHHYQMMGPVFMRQCGRELRQGQGRARGAPRGNTAAQQWTAA